MQPTREAATESTHPQSFGKESLPLLIGAAFGVGAVGAVLAMADISSPVRAPFTFFFLVVAPAAAFASVLRGVDPLSRAVVAIGAAVVVDVLVAQGMLALHLWSIRGGVGVVAAVSAALFLLPPAVRAYGRSERKRTS
jgi:hypothetical protein